MKTKTVKRIYIKMLKFKIKQSEHVNKIKLNKRFCKKIQIAEDLFFLFFFFLNTDLHFVNKHLHKYT